MLLPTAQYLWPHHGRSLHLKSSHIQINVVMGPPTQLLVTQTFSMHFLPLPWCFAQYLSLVMLDDSDLTYYFQCFGYHYSNFLY
jgi:hypothetical protein